VKAEDPEAWRRLVRLHGPLVYLWGRQCGLQPDDAADVLQDVFVAVAGSVETFRREQPGDTFRGWLWTIARNNIRDHFRRRQGQAAAQGGTDAQEHLLQVPAAAGRVDAAQPGLKNETFRSGVIPETGPAGNRREPPWPVLSSRLRDVSPKDKYWQPNSPLLRVVCPEVNVGCRRPR
jgi:RNA polymerase sigma factor (sigma-70 family)